MRVEDPKRSPSALPGPGIAANMLGLLKHRDFFVVHFEALRRRYGDVVRCYINGWTHLVFRPEDVQRVLAASHRAMVKGDKQLETRYVQGFGPGLSSGEMWLRQRRAINPPLRKTAIHRFIPHIEAEVDALAEAWEESAKSGEPRDIALDMNRLSFSIAARSIFGLDLSAESRAFMTLIDRGMIAVLRRLTAALPTPIWFPTPTNLALRRIERRLDAVVYEIIERERRTPSAPFIQDLIRRYDEESAPEASRELRDVLMSLILAAYETTGYALAWTWSLLGQHPEVAGRVREEARAAGGEANPSVAYRYTYQTICESLRLYPTVPFLPRKNLAPFELAGFELPPNTSIDVPVWSVHRHPDYWADPDRFDPDRFASDEVAARHPFAFIPFGMGPRECAGKDFAQLEMLLVLSRLIRRFGVELDPSRPAIPRTTVVLRPRSGVWARIVRS